ncbi:hypothetical protein RUND412_001346 [Rhizina undulata]
MLAMRNTTTGERIHSSGLELHFNTRYTYSDPVIVMAPMISRARQFEALMEPQKRPNDSRFKVMIVPVSFHLFREARTV